MGASFAASQRPQGAGLGLGLTIILGLLFTAVQAYEYAHAAFSFGGNIYGATFFMATGFHGFHVIVGTIFLIVCFFRRTRRTLPSRTAFRFRGGRLVLALRRRRLAVPLRLHLRLGFRRRGCPLMRFVVLLEDEPSKANVRPKLMPDHLAFLEKNGSEVLQAGPLSDEGQPAGGIWIVEAADAAQVTTLVEADPFFTAGLRKSVRVLSWRQVFADGKRLI